MIVKKVKGIVNIVRLCISLICIINFCFLKVTEQYHFLARYVHIPYGERICMDLFSEAIFKHFANSEKWKKSYFLCGILWIWQKFVKITKLCFKQFLTFFFTKQFFHQVIVLDRLSRFKRTNKSGIIYVPWIDLHKFADVIFGITQKLLYFTFIFFLNQPLRQWLTGKKEGKTKIQKLEYLKNKKNFLDEIKNIFHKIFFRRAIIWWKIRIW